MNLFQRLVLADYTFPKDRIFAYLNLDDTDLRVYEKLYPVLENEVPKPDLVIYMQASVSTLMERIGRRARDFERNMEPDYLERLSEAYSYYFFHYRETPCSWSTPTTSISSTIPRISTPSSTRSPAAAEAPRSTSRWGPRTLKKR